MKEEPSLTDMLTCSIRTRMVNTHLSTTQFLRGREDNSLPQTPISPNSQCWDTNLGTLKLIQTPSACGRLSLVILQMELRLSSINSSCLERLSGMLRMDSLCCYHMDLMDKVQSIPQQELKGISSSVIKMTKFHSMESTMTIRTFCSRLTCKSSIAQLLPITSMCSELK